MTKPGYAELIVVLDRSGSMARIKGDMEGGFNTFIAEQKKIPGDCKVSLHQFDDEFETVYVAKPLADVPPMELVPRGSTALYDAIGRTIAATGERLRAMPEHERPDRVLFLVISDGLENASQEFNAGTIATMVEIQKTKYNWAFQYLGGFDGASRQSQAIGMRGAQFASNKAGVRGMYGAVGQAVNSYRSPAAPMSWESVAPAEVIPPDDQSAKP